MLAKLRALIKEADPEVVEDGEVAQGGEPAGHPDLVARGESICTAASHKDKVELTFARGAALEDPHERNSSLDGGTRRAIDIPQGGDINAKAFKALTREAIAATFRRTGLTGRRA